MQRLDAVYAVNHQVVGDFDQQRERDVFKVFLIILVHEENLNKAFYHTATFQSSKIIRGSTNVNG